jgi:hypothetical protein
MAVYKPHRDTRRSPKRGALFAATLRALDVREDILIAGAMSVAEEANWRVAGGTPTNRDKRTVHGITFIPQVKTGVFPEILMRVDPREFLEEDVAALRRFGLEIREVEPDIDIDGLVNVHVGDLRKEGSRRSQ